MTTASPRIKAGKIYKYREWPEQYWSYGAQVGATKCLRYIGANGGGFARPYPGDAPIKQDGYWRWYHPWAYRLRVLFKANTAKTLTVVCQYTTNLAPRPTLRLLANPAIGIAEQVAVSPAGINVPQTLTINATATANGIAWLQLEWLAVPSDQNTQDWCGWQSISTA